MCTNIFDYEKCISPDGEYCEFLRHEPDGPPYCLVLERSDLEFPEWCPFLKEETDEPNNQN